MPETATMLHVNVAARAQARAAAAHHSEPAADRGGSRVPFLRPRIPGRTRQDQRTRIGSRSLPRVPHLLRLAHI
ncbi:hypothetical protein NDU88_004892 [Pleurodeles waltl]|uniref:Uncharacterized protein n=1 Tax=Pleurodeles waltl TaxID=8319 RepID=A0AAV7VK25_PLEWA|nr:hypothetical protein NDU88_004892 [Pleurodeles waltl]